MSTKVIELPGFRIEKETITGNLHKFALTITRTTESAKGPTFIINSVVECQFEVQRRKDYNFSLFVRFAKARLKDKLEYDISYTQLKPILGTDKTTQLVTADGTWRSMYYGNGTHDERITTSVEINLSPLVNPCASLYEDTALTDFKLLGDDGFVLFHKVIAAAHSPYFNTMLEGEWKETAEGVIKVPGTTQATLQHLKQYMYRGVLTQADVKPLLMLSMLYMMTDLEERCLFRLRSELTKDNLKHMVQFAMTQQVPRLLYEILSIVGRGDLNVNEIVELYE